MVNSLDQLLDQIATCRICRDHPSGSPLPHEPQPILRASASARVVICSQAAGTRAHGSGIPFSDPSGERLRDWLGVNPETFYDRRLFAIVPMGFCFPGLDAKGGDLPPRRECAPEWRARVFQHLPNVRLMLLVGAHAMKWHLGHRMERNLTETVRHWRDYERVPLTPDCSRNVHALPLPHPSWRNNGWLRRNPWFEKDVLPSLRKRIEQAQAKIEYS